MDEVSSWAPVVGFTLLPHVGSIWGVRITRREIPTWYGTLKKPSWGPPNWVFAPVWGTLYTSMGYGSYLVWKELDGFNDKSMVPLGLYAGQLLLNWSWTPIFFGNHKIGGGLVTILLTTGAAVATTTVWYHVNKTAAYLMYPYLAWLAFASVINYRFWKDNSVLHSLKHRKRQRRPPQTTADWREVGDAPQPQSATDASCTYRSWGLAATTVMGLTGSLIPPLGSVAE